MSYIYYYNVAGVSGIATRLSNFNSKITNDFDLSANFVSATHNVSTDNIEVEYSLQLTDFQLSTLTNIIDIIFNDYIVGQSVYIVDPNNRHRTTVGASVAPGSNHDESLGYSPLSIVITTSGDIYMCTNNAIGAAVWKLLN